MDFLVGNTGFVGTNLALHHTFDGAFHSTDVERAYGARPDLLVYAGVPAEMFLANRDPAADAARIDDAVENIRRIAPRAVVLVSTIAVLDDVKGTDETAQIDETRLTAYGRNRLALENWVRENVGDHLIVRLPALYGKGIRKNFLYDLIHIIPARLTQEKYAELAARDELVRTSYADEGNGFFRCTADTAARPALRARFEALAFSALNFTDSRSRYQFYDLGRLWRDIETLRKEGVRLFHAATPPVSAAEVYEKLYGKAFVNELAKPPFDYDFRTRHAALFGGADGYLCTRDEELEHVAAFVRAKREELA